MVPLLSALLGCLVCSAAALGLGAPLLRLFIRRETESRLEVGSVAMAASAFLLGQGALAGVWTLIALAGWFTAPVVLTSLALLAAGGIWIAWSRLRPALSGLWAWVCDAWMDSWPWRILLVGTLLLVLFYLIAAWVVSIPARDDGAAYYLALAKWLVAKGQLRPLPGCESFFQMPLLGEFHFAAMMFFGVEQGARLIAAPTMFAGAALLVALSVRCGLNKRAQWVLLAILFSSAAFTGRLLDGKTDLFGFAMGTAAYYWAAMYRGREGVPALRLAGLFVGLAAIAKLTLAASVLPGVVFFVAWTCACEKESAGFFRRVQAVLAGWYHMAFWVLLFVLANCVKNGVLYGEPFAPFFTINASQGWIFQTAYHSKEVARGVLLAYPFLLVFGHVRGQGGNISVLFLALPPLVLLLPRPHDWKRSLLLKTACMGVLGILSYLVATSITSNAQVAPRYILPTLMLLALPLARAVEHVAACEPRPRFLSAVIGCCLVVTLLAAHREKDLRRWVGNMRTYLAKGVNLPQDPTLDALKEINRRAAPGERVYMLSPARLFLRADLLQCINGTDDVIQGGDVQARWAALYARGFSWVLIDRQTSYAMVRLLDIQDDGSTHAPPDLDVECVFVSYRCFVYRIKPRPSAAPPSVKTVEVRPGVWEVMAR